MDEFERDLRQRGDEWQQREELALLQAAAALHGKVDRYADSDGVVECVDWALKIRAEIAKRNT